LGLLGDTISKAKDRVLSGVGVDDGLALDADQIDVGFHVCFVPGHLLEGQFLYQAAPLQNAQRRVNGGQRHGREMVSHSLENLLHGWMVGGVEYRLGDGETLRRYPDFPLPQSFH
jgi:hypothetical protein